MTTLLSVLRSLGVYLFVLSNVLSGFAVALVISLLTFVQLLDPTQARIACTKAIHHINYFLLCCLFWVPLHLEGNFSAAAEEDSLVIVVNHVSTLDPFVFMAFLFKTYKNYHRTRAVMKESLFNVPLFGYIMRLVGVIPVRIVNEGAPSSDKSQYDPESVKRAYEECKKALDAGDSILIFPEGQRNANAPKLNDLKPGAFNISKAAHKKIKIVGMKNIEKVWRFQHYPSGSATITVKVFDGAYDFPDVATYKNQIGNVWNSWLRV